MLEIQSSNRTKYLVWGLVNSQTAGFCHDHEGPKEFNQPQSRVITRLVFTVLLCLLSLLLIFLLLFAQEPTYHTERYWGRGYVLQQFSPFILSVNASKDSAYNTMASSTICPCSNVAFSWTNYVQFYTVSRSEALQNPVRTSLITNGSEFCTYQIVNLPLNTSNITLLGCPNLLDSVVSYADQRTIMESASLMDPVLLSNTVGRHLKSNLDRALNDCVSLMSSVTNWDVSKPFEWLRDVRDLWNNMLQQFDLDPHSTDQDYWIAANKTVATSLLPLIQVIDNKTAISMQVSWSDYVDYCNPLYCDVVKETSWAYRLFEIVAQIGGFGAILLVLIRKILWPTICYLCGWPA